MNIFGYSTSVTTLQWVGGLVALYIVFAVVEMLAKKGTFLHTLATSLLRVPVIYLAIALIAGLVWVITEVVTVVGLA